MPSFNDEDYIKWKNWEVAQELPEASRRYFDLEMKRPLCGVAARPIRVLEIGFGSGDFLKYGKLKGWDVVGVEANAVLVHQARQLGFTVFSSLVGLHDRQGDFDLVVIFDVLEHMRDEDVCEVLASCARLLKSGGRVIARFPNADSPIGLPNQFGDATHVNPIGSGKIPYYAQVAGLSDVYFGPAALPLTRGMLRSLRRVLARVTLLILGSCVRWLFFSSRPLHYFPNSILILEKK